MLVWAEMYLNQSLDGIQIYKVMFLDDELEQIYKENGFCKETSIKLLKAALSRMPKQKDALKMQPEYFLNKLKQIESSWKLFCKRHTEYDPNGIKKYFTEHVGISDAVKNYMKW